MEGELAERIQKSVSDKSKQANSDSLIKMDSSRHKQCNRSLYNLAGSSLEYWHLGNA